MTEHSYPTIVLTRGQCSAMTSIHHPRHTLSHRTTPLHFNPRQRHFSTKPPITKPPTTITAAATKPPTPSPSIWKTLKAPALFGMGLYLGLMIFGEHQETKEESATLAELRNMFRGGTSLSSGGGKMERGGDSKGTR